MGGVLTAEWLDWQRQWFIAFIPGLDMINHSSLEENVALVVDKSASQFQVRCKTKISKDSELKLRYVDASNDEFLFRYGFVEEDNPRDVLEVRLQSVLEMCNLPEQDCRILQQHGFNRLRFGRGAPINDAYIKAIGLS